ncbi:MAG: 4-hydroxythreonine-4-phosphate dehydrogenase 2 [Acidobacteria bacterium ADurb.Bin340]|mgnify:CR=1 FL=1|jgi:4-hydroxythreonine-4-phosphate dehydrogenase|nr:MAG: 4-hydroxythreonine-4-phosphate dehydrogenase 2 [Acidobacteria bacterium ADurb.Bin340]HQL49141.1 4-hydroxythreonine-4-phosphate dehydrogenase PdxA [Holophaga sp.]
MIQRPHLAVTLGDPCGIGPELLLRILGEISAQAEVTIFGTRAGLQLLEGSTFPGSPAPWTWTQGDNNAWQLRTHPGQGLATWIDPVPDLVPGDLTLGQGSAASGRAAALAVEAGARFVMAGHADALLTLPLSKAAVHAAGYAVPGHTEFLQQLAGVPQVRMAFVSPSLSVVLHTVHQSLRSVVEELDANQVAETLVFAARHFGALTANPALRIALCALNPHAGEGGAFGEEEQELHRALEQARAAFPEPGGPAFHGPLPSDTVFLRAVRGEFDLVVALYHDQGLIPIKVLEPGTAVNITLGLPFIRTSPDHGTAFDRAGRWAADPENTLHAADLALRLIQRRKA